MQDTNYETGWTVTSWIEVKKNSSYGFIGDFRCKKSGEKLGKEALFISRTNFKHRGNETDELEVYNREHSPSEYDSVWREWDELKESKKEEIRQLAKKYNI